MPDSKRHGWLFMLLGLNRAGKMLYLAVVVLGVPALVVWFVVLPRMRFSGEDERLFRAARHGDVAGIEQALDAGADVNAEAPIDRKTALYRAAILGYPEAVTVLLSRGADADRRTSDGRTALELVTAAIAEEKDPAEARALEAVAGILLAQSGAKR